jgi:tetraacyldisaccharide 4'-kinase
MFRRKTVVALIEGRTSFPHVLALFRVLSFLYFLGIRFRHFCYDLGFLKTHKPHPCVVSVGNIVAGGSGKTPLVLLLAKILSKKRKVAVLSRGYRSEWEDETDSKKISRTYLPPADFCGDEPYLLAMKLECVPVWVGKNRVRSAELANEEGTEVLILDDGMQHRRLFRHFELVILDAHDPFGKGYFLPRGWLREDPKRLKNADYLFLNHIRDQDHFEKVKKNVRNYSKAPVIGLQHSAKPRLDGKKVGLFCALGNPQRFVETIQVLGGEIIHRFFAADHHPFSLEELEIFAKKSFELGAHAIVCTEKDAVKLPFSLSLPLPIIVVKGKVDVVFGKDYWEQLLEKVIK